jgi:hypothetical protein
MADIFISYASVDRPFARRLADALEARGWSVWWDHSNLHSGEHFDRMIEEAISTAQAVIVVWSPDSIKSDWVRAEAAQALDERKLVPLRINTALLPLRFRNVHTIDLSSWTGETETEPFKRLVEDLSHYIGFPDKTKTKKMNFLLLSKAPTRKECVMLKFILGLVSSDLLKWQYLNLISMRSFY